MTISNITRRAAVTGLAAAPVALAATPVPTPAAAASSASDAALIAAAERYRTSDAYWRAYLPIFDEIDLRHSKAPNPKPALIEADYEKALQESGRRCEAASNAARAVLAIPTATVAGLAAKLAIIRDWGLDEDPESGAIESLIADIEAAVARSEAIALGDLSAVPSFTKGGAA